MNSIYYSEPQPTNSNEVWVIGSRIGKADNHTGYIHHFGTYEGAVLALQRKQGE